MLVDLKKNEAYFEGHKDAGNRLLAREQCVLRLQQKDQPTLSKKDIEERRRSDMVKDMTQKFGNVTVGIHGQELPKFSDLDDSKAYWKYQPNDPNPKVQSRSLLVQN